MASYQYVYVMKDLTKAFPGGREVFKGITLSFLPGVKIGVLGVNGAGKSTLMKILGGVTRPDSGSVEIDGVAHDGLTVGGSMKAGIAFVHQELNLFDNLDVAANVFIESPRSPGLKPLVAITLTRPVVVANSLRTGPTSLIAVCGR